MKVGMHRDLGYLDTLIHNIKDDGTVDPSVRKALETIKRILETLARDVDQAEYTAQSAQNAQRRYGMR